jgi:alkylation response protein AidB-like acyl-CoA dehydrogenase
MINFQPSEEQELLRQTLAGFARDMIRPQIREADEKSFVPAPIVEKGWELGLVQDAIPEAFGGYGSPRSAIAGTFILEELAYGSLGIGLHLLTPRLFTVPILVAGRTGRRRPGCRSSRARRSRSARRPHRAALGIRSDGARDEGRARRWRLDDLGREVRGAARRQGRCHPSSTRARPMGLRRSSSNRGPRAHDRRAREEHGAALPRNLHPRARRRACRPRTVSGGDGANVQPLVDAQRIASAALAVGVGRAAFDYAREYAKERTAFGVPIATKQAIAFMLSNMAIEIDSMRLLAWEAAWRLDKGMPATRESYLAKQYAADAVLKIADNALQVLGGHGYIRDHLVELFLRDARCFGTLDGLAIV